MTQKVTNAETDYGPVNYILSQSLKLSLISNESINLIGRTYVYRKTKNRQLKDGTQATTWRCMECEEIIKRNPKSSRKNIDGEGSGHLVVVNDRLITDPESNHHSECRGADGNDVLAKQIERQKRVLYHENNSKRTKHILNDCSISDIDKNISNAIRVINDDESTSASTSLAFGDRTFPIRIKSEPSSNEYESIADESDDLISKALAQISTEPKNKLTDKDYGPANYILSQSLKLSLISYESRRLVGRTYLFRKTKNRQHKDGTETYWRCLKCEEIIKEMIKIKGGRFIGEGSGRLVVINDRLINDPDDGHHSECSGENDRDVKQKQIVRRKRLLCAERCSQFHPKRKKNGWKTYTHKCDCVEESDWNISNAISVVNEEEMDKKYVSILASPVELDAQSCSNAGTKHCPSGSDGSSVCGSAQNATHPSGKWMLYFSPDEKLLSLCNETDEIFKILQNRYQENFSTDSPKCIVCHYFQSPNFDARSFLPEINEFVLNLLNKNSVL